MKKLLALDPGTAGLGAVEGESDGVGLRITAISAFESAPRAPKYSYGQHDDRVRRTRELVYFLRPKFFDADVVVCEAMSFPPDPHAIAMMCLAWGVICTLLEEMRTGNPPVLIEVQPARWRSYLVGFDMKGVRMTKRALSARVKERETQAQLEALRRLRARQPAEPSIDDMLDIIEPHLRVHALDALGVYAWALWEPEVRALLRPDR